MTVGGRGCHLRPSRTPHGEWSPLERTSEDTRGPWSGPSWCPRTAWGIVAEGGGAAPLPEGVAYSCSALGISPAPSFLRCGD